MRRPEPVEESRIDIVGIGEDELRSILDLLGPQKIGRRGHRRWYMWSSLHDSMRGGMIRFGMSDNLIAEAMWLRYGGDTRMVDGLRNTNGSPSVKFVESHTHRIQCPYSRIAPVIHWARRALHRHHFEWGGGADRWFLWFKTQEAVDAFEERWPDCGARIAGGDAEDRADRADYVRRIRDETTARRATV